MAFVLTDFWAATSGSPGNVTRYGYDANGNLLYVATGPSGAAATEVVWVVRARTYGEMSGGDSFMLLTDEYVNGGAPVAWSTYAALCAVAG
jgi:hypothetical protein